MFNSRIGLFHRFAGVLAVLLAAFTTSELSAAQFQLLHSFAGAPTDGQHPTGVLDTDGTSLYGASELGGSTSGFGAIYGISASGSGFHLIASMFSNNVSAIRPMGGVAVVGSTLYGTTYDGGVGQFGGNGTVFSVNTDGTNLQVVHEFDFSEGARPDTPVFRSGNTVYGAVPQSVSDTHWGAVFSVGPGGYLDLHQFNGIDGTLPANVSVIGTSVYGSTSSHIFSMNLNGSGFHVLSPPAAAGPLLGVDTTIYGLDTTQLAKQLFSMNPDGTNVQSLHTFVGGANDGALPLGNLTYLDGYLYGISSQGGVGNKGTVWRVHPNGTGFEIVHSFLGGANDGAGPVGGLTLLGSTLYGQTTSGGTNNLGTIFAVAVPEPSSLVLGWFAVAGLAAVVVRKRRARRA